MANRYWVGGAGTWNNSTTTNWSSTSGGSSGASAPTSSDVVYFNASSGVGTVTIASTAVCSTLTYTGFTGTLAFGTTWLPVHGTGTVLATADANTLANITGTGGCDLITATAISRTILLVSAAQNKKLNVRISAGTGSTTATGAGYALLEFTSGYSGALANGTRECRSLTLSANMTTTAGSLITKIGGSAYSTSGNIITPNGRTLNFPLEIASNGFYPVELAGALTLGSSYLLKVLWAHFITNDYSIAAGTFQSTYGIAHTLSLGASVITLSGSGTVWEVSPTYTTLNAGTSVISLTSALAKTFIGGGKTYNTLRQGGAGTLTITGSNTFGDIDDVANGSTVRLTAGTTQTVSNLSLAGASGSLVTLDSTTPGSPATLSKASGTVTGAYLSIKDIAATGGATWVAGTGSVNVSGNTGWNFGSLPNPAFLQFF